MADFTSEFWSWYVAGLTILGILGCFMLVRWLSDKRDATGEDVQTMGHVWDEDLEEYNNPLPKWWLNLFYITLFFAIGYLILYPGLGSWPGYLNWTSAGQHSEEMAAAEEEYGPLFARYAAMDIEAVAGSPQALDMGERLFASYCSTCHGSDARGARGFPNLRDDDWLYGGDAQSIKTSIINGRSGVMPGWEAPLGGEAGVSDVTDYILTLNGRDPSSAEGAERGKTQFQTFCVSCHGMDGTGNTVLGAPNLTNNTWLYGGSRKRIMESVAQGRNGQMPPHGNFLGEAKAHLLAAWIYSFRNE